jgi:hypothetical protein
MAEKVSIVQPADNVPASKKIAPEKVLSMLPVNTTLDNAPGSCRV